MLRGDRDSATPPDALERSRSRLPRRRTFLYLHDKSSPRPPGSPLVRSWRGPLSQPPSKAKRESRTLRARRAVAHCRPDRFACFVHAPPHSLTRRARRHLQRSSADARRAHRALEVGTLAIYEYTRQPRTDTRCIPLTVIDRLACGIAASDAQMQIGRNTSTPRMLGLAPTWTKRGLVRVPPRCAS